MDEFTFKREFEDIASRRRNAKLQKARIGLERDELAVKAENLNLTNDTLKLEGLDFAIQQTRFTNDVARERVNQTEDLLQFEQGMTSLKQQEYMTQAKQIMLKIESSNAELTEQTQLIAGKYGITPQLRGYDA